MLEDVTSEDVDRIVAVFHNKKLAIYLSESPELFKRLVQNQRSWNDFCGFINSQIVDFSGLAVFEGKVKYWENPCGDFIYELHGQWRELTDEEVDYVKEYSASYYCRNYFRKASEILT